MNVKDFIMFEGVLVGEIQNGVALVSPLLTRSELEKLWAELELRASDRRALPWRHEALRKTLRGIFS